MNWSDRIFGAAVCAFILFVIGWLFYLDHDRIRVNTGRLNGLQKWSDELKRLNPSLKLPEMKNE